MADTYSRPANSAHTIASAITSSGPIVQRRSRGTPSFGPPCQSTRSDGSKRQDRSTAALMHAFAVELLHASPIQCSPAACVGKALGEIGRASCRERGEGWGGGVRGGEARGKTVDA